jgi:hypothetical protein
MRRTMVSLDLTLDQRRALAGAVNINFKSDTFPLELELELEWEDEFETEATIGQGTSTEERSPSSHAIRITNGRLMT